MKKENNTEENTKEVDGDINNGKKTKVDSNQNDRETKRMRKQEDTTASSSIVEQQLVAGMNMNTKDPSCEKPNIDGNLREIISSNVLENVGDIAKEYQRNSKPFSHNVVKDLFVDGFLGKQTCVYVELAYVRVRSCTAVLSSYSKLRTYNLCLLCVSL